MNKLIWTGWTMYAISFVLPLADMWGYDAFWGYFKGFFAFDEAEYLSVLTINLSNVVMILSPLLIRAISARKLGILLLLGGLHNTRFLWEVCDELSDLGELFPAYYVWWISFFVAGIGLLRSTSLRS
jgi:hypothetical protein